ncbi:stalk domain-containing protein [Paenibacillus antarcticus]|uniref:VWFA domain-containing protein n=1 Tax=Paenibacillus antarcticus TaxID=253703 RepID=A0A168Q3Y7_9BACL|nr:stalk domain-containing protein [Paenibacillus antarcticus]OAB47364.1 hypothetical protein PBAT_06595 [Paenibacillus antarcticus]
MKHRKGILLFMIFIMLAGSLELWAGNASANGLHEFREGEYLVNLLDDGDGQARVFKFTTDNKITSSNTNLRLYINQIEIDAKKYTVDYESNAITMNKAPDSGAEISIKYLIIPTFEWGEGISGKSQIGNALPEGDGSTRVFKLTTNYLLSSSKNVSLYIDGTKVRASEFTFNYTNNSITISEKRSAPGANSKMYFYFPVTSIAGTQASAGETTESPSSGGAITPGKEVESEFQVPEGESYPGHITLNINQTFIVNITSAALQPTYTSYIMVKNANGEVVRRIRIKPGESLTYSLSKLGLPSGGYYFYLKTVNQSGGLAASIPLFVPINNEPQHIQVYIEGHKQTYAQAPVNVGGNILVPFRAIFQSLGATVKWNNSTQMVTATREGKTIILTMGSKIAYVNGVPITLSAAPQLINGSTMVPIRFVSEALGGIVEWNLASNSVVVFQKEPTIPTTAEGEKEAKSDLSSSSPILEKISNSITAPTDIVFVIDTTGSMGEIIGYIKETVKKFVDSVPSGSKFAIVAYRDINYVDRYHKDLEFFSFTNNKNVLKTNLDKLVASGGVDVEESGLEAIHMAVNKLSGSKNSKRIIFITDAPVHDKGTSQGKAGFFLEQMIAELTTNKVILDAIAPTSGLAYKQIIQLVNSNKGKLYDINDASIMLLNK